MHNKYQSTPKCKLTFKYLMEKEVMGKDMGKMGLRVLRGTNLAKNEKKSTTHVHVQDQRYGG